MQYPLVHMGDGAFAYPVNEIDEIASVIRCILTTIPGEHPRLPDFGNHAALVVFRNPVPGLESTITGLVKRDIEGWEPRAKVEEVTAVYDYDQAMYRVQVLWSAPGSGIKEPQEATTTLGGGV
ncbi:MAG: Baseplate wedge protein gp25 [Halanaerobiales bacterium]|nr:Baseplate wedge protein gp25 [Halanaerobiales bacterium]